MDVMNAWNRLIRIQELSFVASSRATTNTGWNGAGKGRVQVEIVEEGVILFNEQGKWKPVSGSQLEFRNVFRWTADSDNRHIRLEHLRFGPTQPVYLFDLVHVSEDFLEPSEPHVCREDLYDAEMVLDQQCVRLRWTITGPKKAETISYTYW